MCMCGWMFPGLLRINWEGFEWSLKELSNELMLALLTLNVTLFFPKWGWGEWSPENGIPLPERQHPWMQLALMRKRPGALHSLACQEAAAAMYKRCHPQPLQLFFGPYCGCSAYTPPPPPAPASCHSREAGLLESSWPTVSVQTLSTCEG